MRILVLTALALLSPAYGSADVYDVFEAPEISYSDLTPNQKQSLQEKVISAASLYQDALLQALYQLEVKLLGPLPSQVPLPEVPGLDERFVSEVFEKSVPKVFWYDCGFSRPCNDVEFSRSRSWQEAWRLYATIGEFGNIQSLVSQIQELEARESLADWETERLGDLVQMLEERSELRHNSQSKTILFGFSRAQYGDISCDDFKVVWNDQYTRYFELCD